MSAPNRLRLTKPMLAVLDVLTTAHDDDPVWGLRICEEADLVPGTVYPILERLTERGVVTWEWETDQPSGRPRRRFYRITGAGRAEVAEARAARDARRRRWAPGGGNTPATGAI